MSSSEFSKARAMSEELTGVALSPTVISLAESAVAKMMVQSPPPTSGPNGTPDKSLEHLLSFYSDKVEKAAQTISNQNGQASGPMLQIAIRIIMFATVLMMLVRILGTNSVGVKSAEDQIRKFVVDSILQQ